MRRIFLIFGLLAFSGCHTREYLIHEIQQDEAIIQLQRNLLECMRDKEKPQQSGVIYDRLMGITTEYHMVPNELIIPNNAIPLEAK